jgi:hypothetical protein
MILLVVLVNVSEFVFEDVITSYVVIGLLFLLLFF